MVLAPARGGVIIGHELARQLGVSSRFVEFVAKDDKRFDEFAKKQGVSVEKGNQTVVVVPWPWPDVELEKGSEVVIVDDTVNNGDTIRACITYVKKKEGTVVAAACMADRRKEGVKGEGKIENVSLVAFWTGSS